MAHSSQNARESQQYAASPRQTAAVQPPWQRIVASADCDPVGCSILPNLRLSRWARHWKRPSLSATQVAAGNIVGVEASHFGYAPTRAIRQEQVKR
jgi:hypothetical protein